MKDISFFTTDHGVASLILAEIPYKETAYIHIRSCQRGKISEMLSECIAFCRACGAEKVFATGDEQLQNFPLHCVIWEMRGACGKGDTANLWPVTEETLEQWRSIANRRLVDVDNSATITAAYGKMLLEQGGAYFVHENGELLGIGLVQDDVLRLIATCKYGMGDRVLETLLSLCSQEQMRLEVASTNQRAIDLYERFGFIKTGEKSRWYQVL